VMHHHTAEDPATAAQLAPLHRGVVPTTVARWPRRELIPKAIGTILDYQPLLVANVVEGPVQRIGHGGLVGRIISPFRFKTKTAPARSAGWYFSSRPPSTSIRSLPSTVVVCDSRLPTLNHPQRQIRSDCANLYRVSRLPSDVVAVVNGWRKLSKKW